MKFALLLFALMLWATEAVSQTVTWTCDRCGSGIASGYANWTITDVIFLPGINIVTVTESVTKAQDTISVTFAPTFPGNTLAGAWGFEEPSGINATDSSGNTNTGLLVNGATRTANGHYRQGITLNGTNRFIQVNDAVSLDYTQSFAYSAWILPTVVDNTWRTVFLKDYNFGLWSSSTYCGAATPVVWFQANGSSGPGYYACSSTPLPTNQWTHLAATYDGTNLRLYKDGAVVATTAVSPAPAYIEPTSGNLTIGATVIDGVSSNFFTGTIDEVRTYNWAIPTSIAPNTVPNAACGFTTQADRTNMAIVSVVGDQNCPVIQGAPPVIIKFPASPSGVKLSGTVKFGAQ